VCSLHSFPVARPCESRLPWLATFSTCWGCAMCGLGERTTPIPYSRKCRALTASISPTSRADSRTAVGHRRQRPASRRVDDLSSSALSQFHLATVRHRKISQKSDLVSRIRLWLGIDLKLQGFEAELKKPAGKSPAAGELMLARAPYGGALDASPPHATARRWLICLEWKRSTCVRRPAGSSSSGLGRRHIRSANSRLR